MAWGDNDKVVAGSRAAPSPQPVFNPQSGRSYNPAQAATIRSLDAQGLIDWSGPVPTYKGRPLQAMDAAAPGDPQSGAAYVDTSGQMQGADGPAPAAWGAADAPDTDAPELARARQDAKGFVGNTPQRVRTFDQGVTFGFGDELNGLGAAALTGANNLMKPVTGGAGYGMKDAYRAVTDEERARNSEFAKAHPLQATSLEIAGGIAAPGMRTVGGLAKGATLAGTVGRGALIGGGMGAVAGAGNATGGLEQRAIGAGEGAVTGAGMGAAAPVLARTGGTLFRAANGMIGQPFNGATRGAIARLQTALQQDGLSPTQVQAAAAEFQRTGVIPQFLNAAGENTRALIRVAATKPGPARDAAQAYRNATIEGMPDTAIARARQLTPDTRSASALEADAAHTIETAANPGGVPAGEGGAALSTELNTRYDQANAAVNEAYRTARAAGPAHLPAAELPGLSAEVRDAVSGFHPTDVPRVTSALNDLDSLSTPTARDLFDIRSRLSNLRASADGVEAKAAGQAVRALDGEIDSASSRNVFTGDHGAVDAWNAAIGHRRAFGRLFEGNDLINTLTERARHGEGRTQFVAPEDASNIIFGRNGVAPRKDLTRDLGRIRDLLGEEHPAWQATQQEASQRLLAPEAGTARFGDTMSAFQARNPQLAGVAISPGEAARVAAARSSIAGAQGDTAAMGAGRAVLDSAPDEFGASLTANAPRLPLAQVGGRQAITDKLGARPNAMAVLRQIAFAPSARRNLGGLFGGEGQRFVDAAGNLVSKSEDANFIAPNTGSQTNALGSDSKGLFGAASQLFEMAHGSLRPLVEKLAHGLTMTEAERNILVNMGIGSPDAALLALAAPAPMRGMIGGAGGRAAIASSAYAGGQTPGLLGAH